MKIITTDVALSARHATPMQTCRPKEVMRDCLREYDQAEDVWDKMAWLDRWGESIRELLQEMV